MFSRLLSCILILSCTLISPLYGGGHDQLGVQTHYGHHGWEPLTTLSAIKELGVGWIRDDLLWNDVEVEKDKLQILHLGKENLTGLD